MQTQHNNHCLLLPSVETNENTGRDDHDDERSLVVAVEDDELLISRRISGRNRLLRRFDTTAGVLYGLGLL